MQMSTPLASQLQCDVLEITSVSLGNPFETCSARILKFRQIKKCGLDTKQQQESSHDLITVPPSG